MSLYEYIQQHAPSVLQRFFDEMQGIAGAVLDEQSRIVTYNDRFAEVTNLAEPKGCALAEFAEPVQAASMVLPPEGAAWNVTLQLTNREDEYAKCQMQVFHEKGNYFLFCCEPEFKSDKALEDMARLNDELSSLNRELEKKTRDVQQANETIKHMARTDSLTELPNRRRFQEELETTLAASRRHGFPVSVAMSDLDLFKVINDTYGHEAGDEALALFAQILKNSSRKEDMPARWGGEEFVVLMPHTPAEEARNLAERVRQQLAETTCPNIDRTITASFGVAELNAQKDDATDLVRWADQALYKAKESGRNQTAVA